MKSEHVERGQWWPRWLLLHLDAKATVTTSNLSREHDTAVLWLQSCKYLV